MFVIICRSHSSQILMVLHLTKLGMAGKELRLREMGTRIADGQGEMQLVHNDQVCSIEE